MQGSCDEGRGIFIVTSCETCRWTKCRNYGKIRNACGNYASEEDNVAKRVIYMENGEVKSSLDEHKRMVEILEFNQRLQKEYHT
jgi:hypothetical protein